VPVKRNRVQYDGQTQEETDFAIDVAESLGSFTTAKLVFDEQPKGKVEA
jgi:hypothetical protein